MNQPYITLTRQDWREVHNALCHAEQEAGQLFSVLKDGGRAQAAIEAIRAALKPAYEQDDAASDRQWGYFDQVKSSNKFRAVWSLYNETDVGSFDLPHPFQGATHVYYDCHWGDHGAQDIVIGGDTWLDLYRAADIAIRQSGDGHHVFIESFHPSEDKPGRLNLSTGS